MELGVYSLSSVISQMHHCLVLPVPGDCLLLPLPLPHTFLLGFAPRGGVVVVIVIHGGVRRSCRCCRRRRHAAFAIAS